MNFGIFFIFGENLVNRLYIYIYSWEIFGVLIVEILEIKKKEKLIYKNIG